MFPTLCRRGLLPAKWKHVSCSNVLLTGVHKMGNQKAKLVNGIQTNYMLNRSYPREAYAANGVRKHVTKDGGIGVTRGKIGVEIRVLPMGDLTDISTSNISIT